MRSSVTFFALFCLFVTNCYPIMPRWRINIGNSTDGMWIPKRYLRRFKGIFGMVGINNFFFQGNAFMVILNLLRKYG